MMIRLMQTLILCAAVPTLNAQVGPEVATQLEQRVRRMMEQAHLPGVAIGVVHGDSLAWSRGYGVADRATGRTIDAETLFQIGSVSKSFTATLLAQLVGDGLVAYDEPAMRYLATDAMIPSEGIRKITVRDLATHRSGLPRQPPTLRRLHGDYPVLAFTHFELYQSLERAKLERPIGTFAYSNFGYSLLGHVLERASGRPYEILLAERIFTPLDMRSSTVTIWPEFEPRLARPYYWNASRGVLEDYTPWDTEAMSPAGGIASTVEDLARYIVYQLKATGEPPLLREPVSRLNPRLAYGAGWFIEKVDGVGEVIQHGGEIDGYTAYVGFSPRHRVGVVILTNAGDAPLDDLANWIFAQVVTGAS